MQIDRKKALIFGTESTGVSQEVIDLADEFVKQENSYRLCLREMWLYNRFRGFHADEIYFYFKNQEKSLITQTLKVNRKL